MGLLDSIADRVVAYGQAVVSRVFAPERDARARALDGMERLYRGQQYEGRGLAPPWTQAPPGRAAPLRTQRPAVQYPLAALIVRRPTAMLFGEGKFPELTFEPDAPTAAVTPAPDDAGETPAHRQAKDVSAWLAKLADEGGLQFHCLAWSRKGCSAGSSALTWAVVEGKFEFASHRGVDCTPTFHARVPTKLIELEKRYQFDKAVEELVAGVRVTKTVRYWHRELWTEQDHTVFVDVPVGDGKEPTWTVADVAAHGLGFVPGVWVKVGDDDEPGAIDGQSLLDGLASLIEDCDRVLGQKARAVFYNQDPERVYFGLSEEDRKRLAVGGNASTALGKTTDGADVKSLEMRGDGQRVAEEHVQAQRARALESARVVNADPNQLLAAAKSGVALRILHGPMLELVAELRTAFGRALRCLLDQVLDAARAGTLAALGTLRRPPPAVIPPGQVALGWGDAFEASPGDIELAARTAVSLYTAKLIDRETLVRWLAGFLGVRDVAGILARLDAEQAEAPDPLMPPKPPAGGGVGSGDGETDDPPDGDAPAA